MSCRILLDRELLATLKCRRRTASLILLSCRWLKMVDRIVASLSAGPIFEISHQIEIAAFRSLLSHHEAASFHASEMYFAIYNFAFPI
jgi:hypothetical protein